MRDLTHEQVVEIVGKITYKPNYFIGVVRGFMHDGLEFKLMMNVPDVDSPANMTKVASAKIAAHPFYSEQDVIRYVEQMIKDLEHHEFQEWFKYNGERQHETHEFEKRNLPSVKMPHPDTVRRSRTKA